MSKRVYISADYSKDDGDCDVVNELNKWGQDDLHKVDFVDMAKVVSGTVANDEDCRICDLKAEFNRQINASSVRDIHQFSKISFRFLNDRIIGFRSMAHLHYGHAGSSIIQHFIGCFL